MPHLRASTADGKSIDDPSPAQLSTLLGDIERGAPGQFLIIERCSDLSGQTFVQALRDDAGYVVEYRDGSAERHYRADVADLAGTQAVLAAWMGDAPAWRSMLPWQQQHFVRRSFFGRMLHGGHGPYG